MVVKSNTRAKTMVKSKKFKQKLKKEKSEVENLKTLDLIVDSNAKTKVHLIAQEINFAKILSGNDPTLRQRKLNKLKSWLKLRSESTYAFSNQDFFRIWQGLYYCMWMSDKPLIQEGVADDIASLLHCFSNPKISIQFFNSFVETMCFGWFGIDQWRIDKFMMLVRRVLRQSLVVISKNNWDVELIKQFRTAVGDKILVQSNTNYGGFSMHFTEIFIEEIAKVSDGSIPESSLSLLIKPYATYIAASKDRRLTEHIKKHIFYHLIKQSDMGREYQEKYEIWKQAGCPTQSVDDVEIKEKIVKNKKKSTKENIDNDEDELSDNNESNSNEKPLDPRAGLVNVEIPEVLFDPQQIIYMLEKLLYKQNTAARNRYIMKNIIQKYTEYMNDHYPFVDSGFPQMDKIMADMPDIDQKAIELEEFEKELYGKTRKIKQLRKKMKKMGKKKRQQLEKSLGLELHGNKETQDDMDSEEQIILEEVSDVKKNKSGIAAWIEEDIPQDEISSDVVKQKSYVTKKIAKRNSVTPKKRKTKPATDPSVTSSPIVKQSIEDKTEETPNKSVQKRLSTEHSPTPIKKQKSLASFETNDEWNSPLKEGETEYFIPSRKIRLKQANENKETEITITPKSKKLLLNPFATGLSKSATPVKTKLRGKIHQTRLSLHTTSAEKRVKIALHKNCHQESEEYIKQVESSPQVPYDSSKKPVKGLLKPNSVPSPINPFYKKLKLKF